MELKKVGEEPRFESTDGVITKFDAFVTQPEEKIRVENYCIRPKCGISIKPGAKICPSCGALQYDLKI